MMVAFLLVVAVMIVALGTKAVVAAVVGMVTAMTTAVVAAT